MLKKLRTQMRWIMLVIVVAFLLSTFLMYEGRSRRGPVRNADGTMMDYEVAQINGRSLMRSELERRLRAYVESYGQRGMSSPDIPALYQSVLDQYILESQMAREVEQQGIRISDAEADQAMKAYADRFYPTREAFYQVLEQSGLKPEDYRKSVARQMAGDRLIRAAVGEPVISEDAVVDFYDTMKDFLYRKPEGFMVYLASYNNSQDAGYLQSRLSSGDTWAEAVSNDRLSSRDVANVTQEPIFLPDSTFKEGPLSAMASLDVGQVSPVFAISSNDFAVGLKASRVSESITPYDDVSADIRVLLRQQQERQNLEAFEASLMSKAQVIIYDTSLFPQPLPAASADVGEAEEPEEGTLEIVEVTETGSEDGPASEDEAAQETPASVDKPLSEAVEAVVIETEAEAVPEPSPVLSSEDAPASEEPVKEEAADEPVADVKEAEKAEKTEKPEEAEKAEEPKVEVIEEAAVAVDSAAVSTDAVSEAPVKDPSSAGSEPEPEPELKSGDATPVEPKAVIETVIETVSTAESPAGAEPVADTVIAAVVETVSPDEVPASSADKQD